jgi:hypothetical protein
MRIEYSDSERKLLRMLRKRPQTSTELTRKFFTDRRLRPYHAQQIIVGLAAALIEKTHRNKEKKRVRKSERQGPHPISYWVEDVRP